MSDVWQEILRVRGYLVLKETNGGALLKPILAGRDHITAECDSHKSRSVRTQVRGALDVPADAYSATLVQLALASDIAQKWLEGKAPRRVIVVPGKLVNLVP
jgi:hypothetical protein